MLLWFQVLPKTSRVSAAQLFHCMIVVQLDFSGMIATNDEKKSLLQRQMGSMPYMLPFFFIAEVDFKNTDHKWKKNMKIILPII